MWWKSSFVLHKYWTNEISKLMVFYKGISKDVKEPLVTSHYEVKHWYGNVEFVWRDAEFGRLHPNMYSYKKWDHQNKEKTIG